MAVRKTSRGKPAGWGCLITSLAGINDGILAGVVAWFCSPAWLFVAIGGGFLLGVLGLALADDIGVF